MPILTHEAIRENPWNVITHTLPTHPTELLLEVAYFAADYCRKSEYRLMNGARNGDRGAVARARRSANGRAKTPGLRTKLTEAAQPMSGAQRLSPNNSSGYRCFCVRLVRHFKDHLNVTSPTASAL
jgi:hypothetical protein